MVTLFTVKDIVTLYENASKLNPKNENLLMGVFFSYTRTLDFQNQNRVNYYSTSKSNL